MGIEELLLDGAQKRGMDKGEKIGRHKKALEIASELKKAGYTVVQIAEFTGLSVKEIEKL